MVSPSEIQRHIDAIRYEGISARFQPILERTGVTRIPQKHDSGLWQTETDQRFKFFRHSLSESESGNPEKILIISQTENGQEVWVYNNGHASTLRWLLYKKEVTRPEMQEAIREFGVYNTEPPSNNLTPRWQSVDVFDRFEKLLGALETARRIPQR